MSKSVLSNLLGLGNEIRISLQVDEDNYVGRECPVTECLGYFKLTPGTGIKFPAPCICPYCGHSGPSNTFFTNEQIEYAKSVAFRKVSDALNADLKSLEFEHKPRGWLGIGISLKVQEAAPKPIHYYREKQLETEVVCDNCPLRYAIYGVFAWCPDCGMHNSLQILRKNFDLARKELTLADGVDKELAAHLVGDALENIVSAFDGFGRQVCSEKESNIRFQNLTAARRKVQDSFGFDFADDLAPADWECACRVFQKRHLIAHKMGVIDRDYIENSNDPTAVPGRKVSISSDEVTTAMTIIEALGRRLFRGILDPKQ